MRQLLFLLMLSLCHLAMADPVVIVHPSNQNTFDRELVARLYLGKLREFPDKKTAVPVLLKIEAIRKPFIVNVLGKTRSQYRAYLSKRMFTGKGLPPKVVDSYAKMLELVSNNPDMIGLLDSDQVGESVKVVLKY